MFDCHTGDRSSRDMRCGPLKEGRQERVAQRVLFGIERCRYVRGDTLHKIPLLLEVLLWVRVGSLRVLVCHPIHDGHIRVPPLHILLQPSLLRRLCPHKSPRYLLFVTIYRPYRQKKASICETFHGDTTKMLLVGSGKYPHRRSLDIRYSRSWWMPDKVPPAPESSAYKG